jgi:hypothetical protein
MVETQARLCSASRLLTLAPAGLRLVLLAGCAIGLPGGHGLHARTPAPQPRLPAIQTCEIKFILDPNAALRDPAAADIESLRPREELVNALNLEKADAAPKLRDVIFLDQDRKLFDAGWIVRLRSPKKGTAYELTFKRRIPIVDADDKAALQQAADEGLPLSDASGPKIEIDWGSKRNLSLSYETNAFPTPFPGQQDLGALAAERAPGGFSEGQASILRSAPPCDAIHAAAWDGEWNQKETSLEIWLLPRLEGTSPEPIVEASFKTGYGQCNAQIRSQFQAALETFLAGGQPPNKTELALEHCWP